MNKLTRDLFVMLLQQNHAIQEALAGFSGQLIAERDMLPKALAAFGQGLLLIIRIEDFEKRRQALESLLEAMHPSLSKSEVANSELHRTLARLHTTNDATGAGLAGLIDQLKGMDLPD